MTRMGDLSWLVYVQLGYAMWQCMRGWPIVRLICKLPIWVMFYRSNKKRVVLLNEVYEDLKQGHEVLTLIPGEEKNGVEIISKEGYWVKAKLIQENEYIIAHQNHIARLWSMESFNNQDFIIDKVEINDRLCIATKLSKRQALLKIGAAYKTAEVRAGVVVYGPKIGVDMNPSVRGFLATIPLFAQAKGHVLLSLWISIALLLLDILRSPLYTIYDSIFNQISTLIMLHCFKHRVWLYRVFSILSPRWSYGDMLKKCVYNGKECGFLVHTLAVFKERDDYELTFGYGDYESSYPTLEDQHFMINYNRIYALPILPKMGSYCKVICKVDSIVVGKASYSDIYPPL